MIMAVVRLQPKNNTNKRIEASSENVYLIMKLEWE